jgi:hypothetical protein
MTTDIKKPRQMSPKGFMHKMTTKAGANASGFLSAHKAWLLSGELAPVTSPILAKLDRGEILPTPALEAIRDIVYDHMIAADIAAGEKSMAAGESTPKDWIAQVYNSKGEIQTYLTESGEIKDLDTSFEKASEADRWVDRKLFDAPADCYGVVSHATMTGKDGLPISNVVMRVDAIGRILKQPRGSVMKKTHSPGRLSFGVKAVQSRATFSRG